MRHHGLGKSIFVIVAIGLGVVGTVGGAASAEAANLGMVTDDTTKSVIVFDADTLEVVSTIPLGGGSFVGDCEIAPDLSTGVVVDFDNELWVVDLEATPPVLAQGLNPVPTVNPGEDVTVTPDSDYAVVCDADSEEPVSVVDIDGRVEVDTLDLGYSCNAVDACSDGSVLVGSFGEGKVARLTIDADGQLTDTMESMPAPFTINVHCAPDAQTGIGIRFSPARIDSFTIPGLAPVSSRSITFRSGVSGGVSPRGDQVMGRSANGALDLYGYDPVTATIPSRPQRTLRTPPALAAFGVDQAAFHPDGSRIFVTADGALNVYDTSDGALIGQITAPEIVTPIGVCVRGAATAECGNGAVEGDEACDDGVGNGSGDGACLDDCSSVQTCGNGSREGTESCDDGGSNGSGSGACVDDCSGVQACGDGSVDGTEACDDAENNGAGEGGCLSDCSGVQTCGDGAAEGTESCDDGESNGTGEGNCLADCSGVQTCGDASADGTELCDDGAGNGAGEGACLSDCSGVQICGDGAADGTESCDDGASNGGGEGACLSDCSGVQSCGDGAAEGTESCDDAGESASCDADCTFAACGDATVNASAGEECDEGAASSDTRADACRTTCVLPMCGDTTLDTGELCELASPGAEICNNLTDDDGDGAIDCVDADCPSVCSHDSSISCSRHRDCRATAPRFSGARCVGATTCGAGCDPVTACNAGGPSLGIVKFAREGDAADFFWAHTVFEPQQVGDPSAQPVSLLVTNSSGVVYRADLLPGDLAHTRGRGRAMYEFKDPTARIGAGSRGGIARVLIRTLKQRRRVSYGVRIWAYGDFSAATEPDMTIQVVVGNDSVEVGERWKSIPGGWRLLRWR